MEGQRAVLSQSVARGVKRAWAARVRIVRRVPRREARAATPLPAFMIATLALEDGTWYRGVSAGAPGEASGEVVFNTSMTGYQEVLTDPSYAGQIVTMTAPLIGNYGVAHGDEESQAPRVAGFV